MCVFSDFVACLRKEAVSICKADCCDKSCLLKLPLNIGAKLVLDILLTRYGMDQKEKKNHLREVINVSLNITCMYYYECFPEFVFVCGIEVYCYQERWDRLLQDEVGSWRQCVEALC